MISTNPDYINADRFTLKQYLAAVLSNKRMVFSSIAKWWKRTTLFWCIPIVVGDIALFVALVYQDWQAGEGYDWALIAGLLAVMFVCFLPFVWIVSYYHAFVSPQKVTKKLTDFIATYIPDAAHVRGISLTNYIFTSHELEYEAAYSLIPSVNAKGRVVKYNKCFILCLHFMADPSHQSAITDKDGQLLDSFLDEFYAYCEGKESCRTLRIESNTMYAMFRVQDLQHDQLITNTMEQMHYLTERFHLLPLYLSKTLAPEIQYWLQANDHTAPAEIIAFNIGIFETENGYSLHLTGSKTYDPNNDDWACNEDYEADEKYLELPMSNHTAEDWVEFQKLVRTTVEKYLELKKEDTTSLFYQKIVTIGFDDGELERIR